MENNIRKIREEKGISRYKMAKDINKPYQTLVNWEENENLSPNKQDICAKYLGVDIDVIFKR